MVHDSLKCYTEHMLMVFCHYVAVLAQMCCNVLVNVLQLTLPFTSGNLMMTNGAGLTWLPDFSLSEQIWSKCGHANTCAQYGKHTACQHLYYIVLMHIGTSIQSQFFIEKSFCIVVLYCLHWSVTLTQQHFLNMKLLHTLSRSLHSKFRASTLEQTEILYPI